MPSKEIFVTLSFALTLAWPTLGQDAGDWPHFQGPHRNGVVEASDWASRGAEKPLWSVNVGMGYSGPSIVDGKLVTMGYDSEAGFDNVLCLDALTGEELWRHFFEAEDTPVYHTGGTLTTPSIHDGVVYVMNREGKAFALEFESGAVIWERNYRSELELPDTFHGYCASPLVLDDRIILDFGGIVAAVTRDAGELIWRTEDYGDAAYTNPTHFVLRGREHVAVVLGMTFFVLDVETGRITHELPWVLQGNAVHVGAPLVMGDRVFLSTAYGKGSALLRLGKDKEPEVLWATRRMRNKVTGCFLYEDHIYGFDESMLKCIDLEGNEAWRVRGLGLGALAIAGDRLLILSSKGELIVAEATPEEYRELSRRRVLDGGSYWTMPVLVGGLVYVRNSEGDLVCLDHRTETADHVRAGGSSPTPRDVPDASALFAAHAQRSGGAVLRRHAALRLTGELEILARGMARVPMTLTLAIPNRWDLRIEGDGLVYTFDGELGWMIKNGGTTLFAGEELLEAPLLFPFADTFAPACPAGATVAPRPVSFGDVSCWKVMSSLPAGAGKKPRSLAHYFAVETGRLVGREGDGISTMVHHDVLEFSGVHLPARVVRYRPDSGQEETIYLAAGEWLEPSADLFARPPGVLNLLRTPEEIEKASAALRARFANELGRYRAPLEEDPEGRFTVEIHVADGELWFKSEQGSMVVDADSEEDGRYRTLGAPFTIAFDHDEDGRAEVLRIRMPDPEEEFLLRRIE